MAEDEVATVRTLHAYRAEMANLIGEYRGRVVDFIGDNMPAEFSTGTSCQPIFSSVTSLRSY